MKTAKLSKGCIKEMVQNQRPKLNSKPYLTQVFQVKNKGAPDKPPKAMILSDGNHTIRAVSSGTELLKDFDVVAVKDYYLAHMKENPIIVIKALSIVFTNLTTHIGSPVEFKDKPDEVLPEVDLSVPQTATLVDKSFFANASANAEEELEKQMLDVAALAAEPSTAPPAASVTKPEPKKETPKQLANAIKDMAGVRPVKSLGAYSTDWTIKVRLTSKGKTKTFTKRTDGSPGALMPLEFVDEDGTQITATLFDRGINRYDPILKVGKCYFVSKGAVRFANKKYTSIPNEHTITLDDTSEIKLAVDDSSIKYKGYDFTSISKLKELDNGFLVNVVGIVAEIGPLSKITKEGNEIIKRSVTIYDETKEMVSVTLWRDLAQTDFTEKQIVGFKTMRITEFNKNKQLSSVGDTQIILNPEDDRIPAIKSLVEQGVVPSKPAAPKFKEPLSMIAEIANPNEETLGDAKSKYYTVAGEIVSISYDKGFFYVACANCKKKVQGETCQTCGPEKGIKVTYTFSVQISDGTASMWVHVFGDEGEKLLGKPAEEVKALKEQPEPGHKGVFDAAKGKVCHFLNT